MLENRESAWKLVGVVNLIVLILVVITWANYNFSLQNPGGNDFLVHWHGTRALIFEGISPYSDEVATRIQVDAYGRPAREGEHELRVAYPIYSALIFAPFAFIHDYTLARAIWMTSLEIGLIILALVSLRLTDWKPGIGALIVYLLFTMIWYHAIRPVILGNAVVFIALMIALALLAIKQERDALAGILVALATIKPQLVVLLVLLIILWAASNKRWRIIIWTFGTLIVLTILGMILVPDWLLQNLAEVFRYPGYNPPGTPGAAYIEWFQNVGRLLGLALTIVLALILIREWLGVWGKDFKWFLWVACLTLVISQWIGIQTDPGNFIILFLPFVFVFAKLESMWDIKSTILPIGLMIIILIGLWVLFLATVGTGQQARQHEIMFFPFPLIVLFGLYLIRGHIVDPQLEPHDHNNV